MKLVVKDGAVRFAVHAKPRARRSRVVGEHGEGVAVALAAPPVDGAANAELLRLVAEVLEVRPRDVELVRGDGSREKLVAVTGLAPAVVEARLRAAFST
jgi:uncharacterized protein